MNLRTEAATRGDKQFTAAQPCKRDGDVMRYTVNGVCVSCAKKRAGEDYKRFRAALKAQRLASD